MIQHDRAWSSCRYASTQGHNAQQIVCAAHSLANIREGEKQEFVHYSMPTGQFVEGIGSIARVNDINIGRNQMASNVTCTRALADQPNPTKLIKLQYNF